MQQFLKIQHITSVTKGPYDNDFINGTRMPQIFCIESSILIKVDGDSLHNIPGCHGCLGLKKCRGKMKKWSGNRLNIPNRNSILPFTNT